MQVECSWFSFSTATATCPPTPISTIIIVIIIISAVVGSLETDDKEGIYSRRFTGELPLVIIPVGEWEREPWTKRQGELSWSFNREHRSYGAEIRLPICPKWRHRDWAFILPHPSCRLPAWRGHNWLKPFLERDSVVSFQQYIILRAGWVSTWSWRADRRDFSIL